MGLKKALGTEKWRRRGHGSTRPHIYCSSCPREGLGRTLALGRLDNLARFRLPGQPAVFPLAGEEEVAARRARVVWCAVGQQELEKCDQWSALSEGNVNCSLASTADDCIALVLVGVSVPGVGGWPCGRPRA